MKIYLGGPIWDCTEEERDGWRNRAADRLINAGHEIIGPDIYIFLPSPSEAVVGEDMALLEQCDLLLVNLWKPSIGSIMEIPLAWGIDKKVYVAVAADLIEHPWLRYYTTVRSTSIDTLVDLVCNMKP